MVSQIILKQFHIIVHTILIRLLHQRAQLLLLSPRPRPYHQRVKIDARNRVLLRDIRQVTIDAQLERRQLHHAGAPLGDEVELAAANLHQEEERAVEHEHLRHQHRDRLQVLHLQAMALRILYLTLFRHTHLHHLDRQLAARQSHGRAAEELVVLDGDATTFDPSPHAHDSM